ncbi:hypothetical protein PFMG_01383 [Plasmodium falciparum IGH-CR14]|uniref:Uncharacterized protein n=2 Tax=Plasmodium falciparum TaxID=5833 RepID=A0A0L1I812_PLAFA|nr:hypothetical protein PFMG_01383 [Plasmodium falciparum IGH-CR14]
MYLFFLTAYIYVLIYIIFNNILVSFYSCYILLNKIDVVPLLIKNNKGIYKTTNIFSSLDRLNKKINIKGKKEKICSLQKLYWISNEGKYMPFQHKKKKKYKILQNVNNEEYLEEGGETEKKKKKKKKKKKLIKGNNEVIKGNKDINKENNEEYNKENNEEHNKDYNKTRIVKRKVKKISKDVLQNIEENKCLNEKEKHKKELENEEFDLLNYFRMEENSLKSQINPEKSKDIIRSEHFKQMMSDLNIKEDDVLQMLKRSEKDVTHFINKNLTLDEIQKKAESDDEHNEKLFDIYMNNKSINFLENINFKRIGKKYKDIVKEVIDIFIDKNFNFNELIKYIDEDEQKNNCIYILKENILFKDLDNATLFEIIKKSILIAYLNITFSNDIHNYDWNAQIENYITTSLNTQYYRINEISYSNNSININIKYIKNDKDNVNQHEEIEYNIKDSIRQYEHNNNLNILSNFNIFIYFT